MVSTNFPSLGSLVNVVLCTGRKWISALEIPLHSAVAAVMACAGSLPAVIIVRPSAFVAPALKEGFSSTWIAEASVRNSGFPVFVISGIDANAAPTGRTAIPATSFVIAHPDTDAPPRGAAPLPGNRSLEFLRTPPASRRAPRDP